MHHCSKDRSTVMYISLLFICFCFLGAANSVPSCSCNGNLKDDGAGECRTTYKGKKFCFVDSGGCSDQRESSSTGWFWSYRACQSGVGNNCATVGGDDIGSTCVFPFIHNDKSYDRCTVDGATDGEPWCSTKVDGEGVHVRGQGKWGHCGQGCQIRDETAVNTGQQQPNSNILTRSFSSGNCFAKDLRYNPIDDIRGQGRTRENSAEACQRRCVSVSGCSYFSFWPDGGCHLSSSAAIRVSERGPIAGPKSCSGEGVLSISSVYNSDFPAQKCVDGNVNRFCHTLMENYPYVVMEYPSQVLVKNVKVVARTDCCFDRVKQIKVSVTNVKPTRGQLVTGGKTMGYFAGPASKASQVIPFTSSAGLKGKYVVIQQQYKGYINYAEIDITKEVIPISEVCSDTITVSAKGTAVDYLDGDWKKIQSYDGRPVYRGPTGYGYQLYYCENRWVVEPDVIGNCNFFGHMRYEGDVRCPENTDNKWKQVHGGTLDSRISVRAAGSPGPTPVCGKENGPTTRIIGGNDARPNQYPWMVKLIGCGGSLISDRHILTAAHCVKSGQLRGKNARVGAHNGNDGIAVPIKEWKCFTPNCLKSEDHDHDIAIVILEKTVNFGTVCLPTSNNEDYKGKKALALGWGWNPSSSQYLQMVELPVAERHIPYPNAPSETNNWLFTDTKIVNGEPVGVCRGDSGGPLLYQNSGSWTVIGVLSTGGDCSNHTGRQAKWDKVDEHLQWIKDVIRN